jgi:hypothetical protein
VKKRKAKKKETRNKKKGRITMGPYNRHANRTGTSSHPNKHAHKE